MSNQPFPQPTSPSTGQQCRDTPIDERRQPLDIQGGVLATVALGALTWGLTIGSGHTGWTRPAVISLFVGLGLLTAFVWVEKARGENAMMPLALFGSSSFIGLTLLTLLLYGALGVLVVLVPYVLIEAAAYSGTAAGAALLPFAVVLALVSPLLGRLSGRIGARVPLSVGSLTTRAVGVNPTFTSPTEIAVSKRGGQTWTTHPASSHW
jgi:hypothetical protein